MLTLVNLKLISFFCIVVVGVESFELYISVALFLTLLIGEYSLLKSIVC